MSKPFTLSLLPGKTAPQKPGWHKRALAADRAALSRGGRVAPQYGRGTKEAEAKAVEYARWIAARDGIELPTGGARVQWDACRAGMRPRWVDFGEKRGAVTIALPHWSYEAPEAVAVELLAWAAPVVTERPAAPAVAPLDAEHIAEALALPYGEPCETELSGTVEAEPFRDRAEPAPYAALAPIEAIAAESDTKTGANYSDPIPEPVADEWRPSAATHPIVALCLSEKAFEALAERVLDGTFRAAGRAAAGGAWRLTLDDARACADIPSLRLVGMPRKPRAPRAAAPAKAIAMHTPAKAIGAPLPAYMVPSAGLCGTAVTYHSAPTA